LLKPTSPPVSFSLFCIFLSVCIMHVSSPSFSLLLYSVMMPLSPSFESCGCAGACFLNSLSYAVSVGNTAALKPALLPTSDVRSRPSFTLNSRFASTPSVCSDFFLPAKTRRVVAHASQNFGIGCLVHSVGTCLRHIPHSLFPQIT